jgi:glucokinase
MSTPPLTALGLDIGGTKIAGGVVSLPGGQMQFRHTLPTTAQRGGAAVFEDVQRLAQCLIADALAAQLEVEIIGLGLCELVSPGGEVLSANCIDWIGLPVRERLAMLAPTTIEADVRAAAVAESAFGAGRPFRNFLYITVGTGISCCLVLDGAPYLGARGLTGTMASSPLSVPCERCGHINRRTLEEIASGPGLVARYRATGATAATGQQVLAAVIAGDPHAKWIVESASEALESHVALLVGTLDPEAVVIGGGLGLSKGPYWEHFLNSTRRHIWSGVQREIPILRAEIGVDAGWMGAAISAYRNLHLLERVKP